MTSSTDRRTYSGDVLPLEINITADKADDDDDDGVPALTLSAELLTVGALLCLVIVFTLLGNGLVVGAVLFFRRLRSVTNYFVVSLAVADLTVAVLVMPYSAIYEMTGRWTFSWVVCYFWISCDVMCCTASILHLCVIAIDRYLAITEPLTYAGRMSSRRAATVIGAVWTCSAAISFVPIFAGWFADPTSMTVYRDSTDCGLHVNQTYAVVSSATSFYLPLGVMAVVYARIFRIARHQSMEIRKLEDSLDRDRGERASRAHRRQARRNSRDSKAVKTLGTLMGLFCLSWLPFFVVYVAKPFCKRCDFPPQLISLITWLGYCNSFFNPCVYALINRDFRFAYKSILLCRRSIRGSSSSAATARRSYAAADDAVDGGNRLTAYNDGGRMGGRGDDGGSSDVVGGSAGGREAAQELDNGYQGSKLELHPKDIYELEMQTFEMEAS